MKFFPTKNNNAGRIQLLKTKIPTLCLLNTRIFLAAKSL